MPPASTDSQSTDFPDLPPAPPSHVVGQGYSAHNPVPTVQSYKATQQKHEEQAHAYAEMVERRAREAEERERRSRESRSGVGGDAHAAPQSGSLDAQAGSAPVNAGPDEETNAAKVQEGKKTDEPNAASGANEKARMMEQMNANQRELFAVGYQPLTFTTSSQTYRALRKGGKGPAPSARPHHRRRDHRQRCRSQRRVPPPLMGPAHTPNLLIVRIDFDSKQPATKGTNVLYHAFPPPQPISVKTAMEKLKLIQYGIAGFSFFIWLTVAFGSGLFAFFYRSTLCSVSAFILMTAVSLVERSLERDVEKVRQDMGRQRGEAFSPPVPESVEWMNGLIKLVWGLVDP